MASAMLELQEMLRRISYSLALIKQGDDWELWNQGEDFGKSEAEIAVLQANSLGYYSSYRYGTLAVGADGAIRDFKFGPQYEGHSLLWQLFTFLKEVVLGEGGPGSMEDFDIDVRPHGSLIDIDIVAIETNWWNEERDGQHWQTLGGGEIQYGEPFRKVVGRFAYDSHRNVLVHRTA